MCIEQDPHVDFDCDGICDPGEFDPLCTGSDNCPHTPNADNQFDTYPPDGGNGCGNACECEGNFDNDEDQDGSDAATFKTDFGRNPFSNPCSSLSPCNGNFDFDEDVDGGDAAKCKEDFGRNPFLNPCPYCPTDLWCISYPE
jgi:hypothetical protein